MNEILKREFLPTSDPRRKRWFATMSCQRCKRIFTVQERVKDGHIVKPCEACALVLCAYKSFMRKAKNKHGDKFIYEQVTEDNYVNLFTPVTIVCRVHGEFKQKPKDHISSINAKLCCPSCVHEFNKIHNKRTIESWKVELQNKFPSMKMVKHGNADSNTEKCTILCADHGVFDTTLATIKRALYLCPLCAQDNNSWGGRFRRTDVKGFLYFIYIPSLCVWKLGVTSKSVEERLRTLKLPYEVQWSVEFSTLAEAYVEESRLFKKYKNFRRDKNAPPILGACKGNSELMLCDIPITAIHRSDSMSKEP